MLTSVVGRRRVALVWACTGGHVRRSASSLGGSATLVADMPCVASVCACGDDYAGSGCRSRRCGQDAHLVLVDAVCTHPFRINEHVGTGMCSVCGEDMASPASLAASDSVAEALARAYQ